LSAKIIVQQEVVGRTTATDLMQAAAEEITTTAILKSDSRNIKSPDKLSGLFYDTYFFKSNF
jgi:hypothetical protein